MGQTEEAPLNTHQQHHPEEDEHHENGASKMFRKVRAKAKKFKNSLTKPGQSHEHDHDVVEEDDEDDELEPEVNSPPGVTGKPETLTHPKETNFPAPCKPETLTHPKETNFPAPEEIVPPGIKVHPAVSSDYTKPIEPVPLQDTSYGHEAPAHSVRTTDISDKEERREAPAHHPLPELSDREESKEAHEPMNTPVSLLSGTEDVTRTFTPSGEDDHLGGQRKDNIETLIKLEDDPAVPGGGLDYLSGVSNNQSKATDPTKEGSGDAGVPEISESPDQKPGQGFNRDLSTRSKEFREFDRDFDSVLSKDSLSKFAGESEAEPEKDFSTRSHEFDMKTESGMDKNSPSRSHEFDLKTESGMDKNSPSRSHEFDLKTESGMDKNSPSRSHESDLKTESEIDKNSPMGFGSESGAELGRELPTGSDEFDQKIESIRNKPESDDGLGAPLGGNFPVRRHELDVKKESGIDKDSPTGFDGEPDFLAKGRPGYGEESSEERNFPARSDDVKVENELGRDLPTGTHDQFSPDISRPKERDEFEESRDDFEETRDETKQETKPKTYTQQVASMLGYSGEIPAGDQTQVAGTVDEKLTPVNENDQETESAVTTKLPLSGGENGVEETKRGEEKGVSDRDYLTDKPTPGEEDKALSEVTAEKLQIGGGEEKKKTTSKEEEVTVEKIPTEKLSEEGEQGEAVEEEVKGGGGMVGMIKGWFGGGATEEVKPKSPHSVEESSQSVGATDEVKPKSPHSVEDSSQSLGSTVGTKGFPDSGGSELEETGVGGGAVPVQRGV